MQASFQEMLMATELILFKHLPLVLELCLCIEVSYYSVGDQDFLWGGATTLYVKPFESELERTNLNLQQ